MRRFGWLLGIAVVVVLVLAAGIWFLAQSARQPSKTSVRVYPVRVDAVTVALVPTEASVRVGEVFTMSIVLDNPKGQSMIGADTFLDFDPDYLEVVGPDGKPASQITPGTMLPVLLFNGANNSVGVITYCAGILGGERQEDTILMATISFRAKKATAATEIKFSSAPGRQTDVAIRGGP